MEDKIFDELKRQMQDLELRPDEKAWRNISSKIENKRLSWIKTASIAGVALLTAGITALVVVPKNHNVSNAENQLRDNTHQVIQHNDNKAVTPDDAVVEQRTNDVLIAQNNTLSQPTNAIRPHNVVSVVKESHTTVAKENNIANESSETIVKQDNTDKKDLTAVNNSMDKPVKATRSVVQKNHTVIKSGSDNDEESFTDGLLIPNAFQPTSNDENINTFKPLYKDVNSYEMRIFTRNGSEVFSSKDITIGWDGKIKGKTADQGTYVYYIKYEDTDGRTHTKKGTLWLNR